MPHYYKFVCAAQRLDKEVMWKTAKEIFSKETEYLQEILTSDDVKDTKFTQTTPHDLATRHVHISFPNVGLKFTRGLIKCLEQAIFSRLSVSSCVKKCMIYIVQLVRFLRKFITTGIKCDNPSELWLLSTTILRKTAYANIAILSKTHSNILLSREPMDHCCFFDDGSHFWRTEQKSIMLFIDVLLRKHLEEEENPFVLTDI